MTVTSHESTPTGGPEDGFTDYEALLAATKTESEPIPLGDYANAARQIEQTRAYYQRQQASGPDQLAGLREIYVEDEPDERLQRFALVMIDAPLQAARDTKLGQLRQKDNWTPEEKQMSHAIKDRAIEYNHLLRDVILDGRGQFDRPTLNAWMMEASANRYQRWARDAIAGASAEVALYDALNDTPGMSDVRFTSVEEDRRGIDIRSRYGNLAMGFDAKFGDKPQKTEWKEVGHERVLTTTISVAAEAIDDLRLSAWGRRELPAHILEIAKRPV